VLDEPTNDLDLETLELLQELLADYPGTVLLVSHDRDFIDRVVTSVIATVGDGRWIEYAGGYSDMLAQRAPVQAVVAAPARVRPKPEPAVRVSAKRLTFKDRHALETLPARIAALETEVAKLNAVLDDPDLYTRDAQSFAATTTALETARSVLAAAEEQWLELEMRREELEG
jgi:ATP-binding cassette subfamily F protein uup